MPPNMLKDVPITAAVRALPKRRAKAIGRDAVAAQAMCEAGCEDEEG